MKLRTNLVGQKYGPFEVIADTRSAFYEPVTVRTICCGRVIQKKGVIALNTIRWRAAQTRRKKKAREQTQCAECAHHSWKDFTQPQLWLIQRAMRQGVVPEWRGKDGARRIVEHFGRRPSPKHRLGRRNPTQPHGPDNSVWMTASELLLAHKVATPIVGIDGSVTTIPRAAQALGLSRQAIHQRQQRGYTPEEAGTTPKGEVPERLKKLRAKKAKTLKSMP